MYDVSQAGRDRDRAILFNCPPDATCVERHETTQVFSRSILPEIGKISQKYRKQNNKEKCDGSFLLRYENINCKYSRHRAGAISPTV